MNLLPLLLLFLVTPRWLAASPTNTSYRTQLERDLDGDRIPDTVSIRECGFAYKISIRFSSGRPKLHLTLYHAQDEVGLNFQTSDLDNDRDEDLIVTSATSVRPIAVWLNYGKAKFVPASPWKYGGPGKQSGPTLHRRTAYQPELPANSSGNLLPEATGVDEHVGPGMVPQQVTASERDQVPSVLILQQVPARGPPLQIAR